MNFKLWLMLFGGCRNREKGFVLPIALGLGLIMILVAMMMINRSKVDQTTASSEKSTARSLAAAETGVNRVLAMLNTPGYGYLLKRTQDALGKSGSAEQGWVNPNGTSTACGGSGGNYTPAVSTIAVTSNPSFLPSTGVFTQFTADWTGSTSFNDTGRFVPQVIETGTNKSEFEIIYYRYNSASQTGTLVVEGRDGFDRVQSAGEQVKGVTQLVVTVNLGEKPLPVSFPGLYAGNIVNLGNNDVLSQTAGSETANVICTSCTVPAGATCVNGMLSRADALTAIGAQSNAVVDGQIYVADPTMPGIPSLSGPLIPIVTDPQNTTATVQPSATQTPLYLGDLSGNVTLPRTGDQPRTTTITNSSGASQNVTVYDYVVESASIGNNTFTVNHPGNTTSVVRIYLRGDMSFSGGGGLVHNCPTSNPSPCPQLLNIFGIGPNSPQQTLTLSGGSTAPDVFIYVPNGTVGINGGSSSPDFRGAVWAKNWDGSSSNNAEIQVPDDMPSLLGSTLGFTYQSSGLSVIRSTGIVSWQRQQRQAPPTQPAS